MVPFRLDPQSGVPVHEQLVQAAKKAIVSGRLRPGQVFPSVRTLAAALKIHVNTAQRAVAALKQEGLLEIQPGIGAIVSAPPPVPRAERARLLRAAMRQILIEAIGMGAALAEFQEIAAGEWRRLQPTAEKQEV